MGGVWVFSQVVSPLGALSATRSSYRHWELLMPLESLAYYISGNC